ncbi:hypothetical protein GCM10020254_19580 [Streptomyces goshikiensis]
MSPTVEGPTHASVPSATAVLSAPISAAYSYCEAVTGAQARNFAYGIRLLPTDKRHAMSALYAFSRRVDDIGDGTLAPEAKLTRLEETRALLGRIRAEDVDEDDTDPVAVALAHAARRFPIPSKDSTSSSTGSSWTSAARPTRPGTTSRNTAAASPGPSAGSPSACSGR